MGTVDGRYISTTEGSHNPNTTQDCDGYLIHGDASMEESFTEESSMETSSMEESSMDNQSVSKGVNQSPSPPKRLLEIWGPL